MLRRHHPSEWPRGGRAALKELAHPAGRVSVLIVTSAAVGSGGQPSVLRALCPLSPLRVIPDVCSRRAGGEWEGGSAVCRAGLPNASPQAASDPGSAPREDGAPGRVSRAVGDTVRPRRCSGCPTPPRALLPGPPPGPGDCGPLTREPQSLVTGSQQAPRGPGSAATHVQPGSPYPPTVRAIRGDPATRWPRPGRLGLGLAAAHACPRCVSGVPWPCQSRPDTRPEVPADRSGRRAHAPWPRTTPRTSSAEGRAKPARVAWSRLHSSGCSRVRGNQEGRERRREVSSGPPTSGLSARGSRARPLAPSPPALAALNADAGPRAAGHTTPCSPPFPDTQAMEDAETVSFPGTTGVSQAPWATRATREAVFRRVVVFRPRPCPLRTAAASRGGATVPACRRLARAVQTRGTGRAEAQRGAGTPGAGGPGSIWSRGPGAFPGR